MSISLELLYPEFATTDNSFRALTIVITAIVTAIMPLRQQLQCFRIGTSFRLDKHRLIRMNVRPIISARHGHVPIRADINPSLTAIAHGHHNADSVPIRPDERRQPRLKRHGLIHVLRTVVDAIWRKQCRQSEAVGRQDHALHVAGKIAAAVHRHADEFDIVVQFVEVGVGPAISAPERDEGPTQRGVDHDEALVLPNERAVVRFEDLRVGAEVEAGVVAFDVVNVELVGRNEELGVSLAVEDEHELGVGMEGVGDEELEVGACVGRFVVGIEYQRDA